MIEQILAINEQKINLLQWEIENPSANIFIAHGLGEHSGRYDHFANHFNQLGYNVYAHDHQGHGKSSGKQGHIDSFIEYSNDLRSIVESKSVKGLDNILLGHSLGGVIATGFLVRHPNLINKCIISAPGFEKKIPPNPVKAAIGKLLANIFPKLTLWNEIEADWICRSTKIVNEYEKDPLVHDRVSAKFFTSFLAEYQYIRNNVQKINTPTLMLLPGADLIVNHQASEEIFNLLSSSNKKLVHYPNSYHELLNEDKERFEAYSEIENWLAN